MGAPVQFEWLNITNSDTLKYGVFIHSKNSLLSFKFDKEKREF